MRVTEAFIDDIVANADTYTCMPLCADVQKLVRGDRRGLTHMYDAKSGRFLAPMIGAFYSIRKQEDEHGVSLIGTARINRRDDDVTAAIQELYDEGALKFSFEIRAAHAEEIDGVTVVDAAEGNRLTAMAVVTTPAYPSAKALDLAAELDLSALRMKVWEALNAQMPNVYYDILQMGADWVYLYLPETGKMLRMEFQIGESDITVTDIFEVRFERAEVNDAMNDEKLNQEQAAEQEMAAEEAQVKESEAEATETQTAEVENEGDSAESIVSEEDPKEDEKEDNKDEEEEKPDETAELKAELERVRAELQTMQEAQKREKEAKELAEKQGKIRAFAERIGLDLSAEAVRAACEQVNYEALAAEVPEKKAETQGNVQHTLSAEMKLSPYGNMFDKN